MRRGMTLIDLLVVVVVPGIMALAFAPCANRAELAGESELAIFFNLAPVVVFCVGLILAATVSRAKRCPRCRRKMRLATSEPIRYQEWQCSCGHFQPRT